jgi:hypothetical protein
MPGHRRRRASEQRPSPTTSWTTRGSDPATAWSPDRSPGARQGWAAPQRRRDTRRRRLSPLDILSILLFRPLKLIVDSYLRALLRATMAWLLPLGVLAAVAFYLSSH